jgi:hypothetical protein
VGSVRNVQGQLVKTISVMDFQKNTTIIDFSGLPVGYYILDISTKSGALLFKEKISVIK